MGVGAGELLEIFGCDRVRVWAFIRSVVTFVRGVLTTGTR
jgi:hypothetical protein